jgi:transcriptional regulator with XRE-family HTH domain
MNCIGECIQSLRKAKGWSQKTLGEKAGGRNVETINRIEHNHDTGIDTLKDIANALGVRMSELMPDDERIPASTQAEIGYCKDNIPEHNECHVILESALHGDKLIAEWFCDMLLMYKDTHKSPPSSTPPLGKGNDFTADGNWRRKDRFGLDKSAADKVKEKLGRK